MERDPCPINSPKGGRGPGRGLWPLVQPGEAEEQPGQCSPRATTVSPEGPAEGVWEALFSRTGSCGCTVRLLFLLQSWAGGPVQLSWPRWGHVCEGHTQHLGSSPVLRQVTLPSCFPQGPFQYSREGPLGKMMLSSVILVDTGKKPMSRKLAVVQLYVFHNPVCSKQPHYPSPAERIVAFHPSIKSSLSIYSQVLQISPPNLL